MLPGSNPLPTESSSWHSRRESTSLWMLKYCAAVLRWPWIPILFFITLVGSMTTWVFVSFGLNPTCNVNYHRWNGNDVTDRWDAYVGAGKETYGSVFGFFGSKFGIFRQFQLTQMSAIVYEDADPTQNVVTVEHIREIWEFEDELSAIPGYEDFCMRIPLDSLPEIGQKIVLSVIDTMRDMLSAIDNTTNCLSFKSLITELKGYIAGMPEFEGKNVTAQDLTQEILEEFCLNATRKSRIAASYFGTDWNEEEFFSTRIRSMFIFGLPLKGYRNKHDRANEQTAKLGKWQLKFLEPVKLRNRDRRPGHVVPFQAFPFAMEYYIFEMVLKQAALLIGSFIVMFGVTVFFTRSLFIGLLGPLGCMGAIPCACALLNGVMGVRHVDILDIIAIFYLFTYGTSCMYMIFAMYWHGRSRFSGNLKRRFAYAAQRSFLSLGGSYLITVSCLLVLTFSGVKLIVFYALFSVFLMTFLSVFTFTYYLAIVGIWAVRQRRKRKESQPLIRVSESMTELDTATSMSLQASPMLTNQQLSSQGGSSSDSSSLDAQKGAGYPYTGVLDFLRHKPIFRVDAACMSMERTNKFERFFYMYICPLVYFYRLPIVMFVLTWSCVFGYFAFSIDKKLGVQFLDPYHELQHALNELIYGFRTSLSDFSLVYVWGLEPKPKVTFAHKMSVTDYGAPVYRQFNITDPKVQAHINWTDKLIHDQDFIDTAVSKDLGVNAWAFWDAILDFDRRWVFDPVIGPIVKIIFGMGLNFTEPPRNMPISAAEYQAYGWLWQTLLSQSELQEPDPYFPGTVKVDTTGFSVDDYSLQYIGVKKNIRIPAQVNYSFLRSMYEKAMALEKRIEAHAIENQIDFPGYVTSIAFLPMTTADELPKHTIKNLAMSVGLSALWVLIFARCPWYAIWYSLMMASNVFLVIGFVYLCGWQLGTDETLMLSSIVAFCTEMFCHPIMAIARDKTPRSTYGRMQAAMTTYCVPISSAFLTNVGAGVFMFASVIVFLKEFAGYVMVVSFASIMIGLFVLPALYALVSYK